MGFLCLNHFTAFIVPSLIALITNCVVPYLPGLLLAQPLYYMVLEGMGPCLTSLCVPHSLKSNAGFISELACIVEQMYGELSE